MKRTILNILFICSFATFSAQSEFQGAVSYDEALKCDSCTTILYLTEGDSNKEVDLSKFKNLRTINFDKYDLSELKGKAGIECVIFQNYDNTEIDLSSFVDVNRLELGYCYDITISNHPKLNRLKVFESKNIMISEIDNLEELLCINIDQPVLKDLKIKEINKLTSVNSDFSMVLRSFDEDPVINQIELSQTKNFKISDDFIEKYSVKSVIVE